ncbi:MAG: leuS [Candidatus Saccharibacteria bacterium]|nr:leuS [Candidatus Saccharibacteria bacterium]MDB5180752.1 leuS [Candidatus Saccharibacteria bacterium]
MERYNPKVIEPKWQQIWEDQKAFVAVDDSSKQKFYISCMFPYPSGVGMHVGHAFEHFIVDAIARFHRQHGENVLNPMGWDSFGLPAENYAIKTGTAPSLTTKTNIANFKKQLAILGVGIDWTRELNTSDPEYYKWTQWIFTKFFERGLAYQKESLQWWCPVDKTVLANEQVEGGHCWRCGSVVEKKSMKQWFFKITDYADDLLNDIEDLDWPQKIKTAQTNWIGKSQGAEIEFKLEGSDESITVFSTRPDTIFGATFLVLAPEHELSKTLAVGDFKEFTESYIKTAVKKSEIERTNDTKEKTGVFTGSYAINPVSNEKVPVWVADYVLGGYGTGAVMGVPAHDERDFAFAEKYNLPIIQVVQPETGKPQENPEYRKSIVAIVRDPKTNKYLSINWGADLGGNLFVGGGREENEDIVETAIREIAEETGYTNIQLISKTDTIHHNYFAHSKNVARRIEANALLFELIDDTKINTALEANEQGKFTVEWLSEKEIVAKVRDELHATSFDLLVGGKIYHGEGILVNSGEFDGMPSSEAREKIVDWLTEKKLGHTQTTYKMRDWLISRQRYWGAPIPIIHCAEHGAVAVPEKDLPVVLPEIEDYAPKGDGKSALARATDWVNTTCPECGGPALRETDTMDGYACSSWYLLRYADPNNTENAWSREKVDYWSPVNYYVGGDHAVAHLLYVRFWTHVFYDMGLVGFKEPVKKLIYHGLIGAEDGRKMSKSLGNTVDPIDIINQGYGTDALRTYELFMGPIEIDADWSSKGIAGSYRFLNRVWTLSQEYINSNDKSVTKNDNAIRVAQHKTIRKVTDNFRRLSFNTAISALMEYVNDLYKFKVDGFSDEGWHEALVTLVQLIAPFAPHISDELWSQLGGEGLVQNAQWPVWDEALIIEETITIAVQVNGKLRGEISIGKDEAEADVKAKALAHENVVKFLTGEPKKVIYVAGRLVSIVA